MTEAIGWVSSALLVLTISRQVWKQYREGTSDGVSKWLFLGEISANVGFVVYSWLVGNWVFVATSVFMVVASLAGLAVLFHHRRREQPAPQSG
jgi:uncharacterized protein with PQ loop repeat